jgi:hypothetical protein
MVSDFTVQIYMYSLRLRIAITSLLTSSLCLYTRLRYLNHILLIVKYLNKQIQ